MINCFIFTALACEALPFIHHFKLKKSSDQHPFTCYHHDKIVLVITGTGKVLMGAAVAYALCSFEHLKKSVLINVGIAGHPMAHLGQLFSVEKIIDDETDQHYYPQSVINLKCLTAPLYTVSKPNQHYPKHALYDMESSGFYAIGLRFTTAELMHIFKIISDNSHSSIKQINAQRVTAWIKPSIEEMGEIIQQLQHLATSLVSTEPRYYHALKERYYFNVNNQRQLKKILQQWELVTDGAILNVETIQLTHAKAVLHWLQQQLNRQTFNL